MYGTALWDWCDMTKANAWEIRYFIILHIELIILSLSGVCSKMASKHSFMSKEYIFYYGLVILNLAVYAIVWQQIIKKLPLNTAYANKAIMVVWGMVWGVIFFGEKITWNMIVGGIVVIIGVITVVQSDKDSTDSQIAVKAKETIDE